MEFILIFQIKIAVARRNTVAAADFSPETAPNNPYEEVVCMESIAVSEHGNV